METSLDLGLNEERSASEATIGVLVEDGSMVLLRILAAFKNERNQRMKLGKCVAGIMNMCWRL